VQEDLSLQKYETSEDCVRKKKKTHEAQTAKVYLGRPKKEDTWRKIELTLEI
jgi:hypothetical protein